MGKKIEWRILSPQEVEGYYTNRCRAKRSSRGTVECELPNDHMDTDSPSHSSFHSGRSDRGSWISWKVEDAES